MSVMFFDALTKFGSRPRTHGKHPWTFEHLIDDMAHCSIAGAVVRSTAQTLYDANLENQKLSRKLAAHDNLFAAWQAIPHWTDEFPHPDDLIPMMADNDVRIVSLTPNTSGWPITAKLARPLLVALEKAQIPVLINFGSETTPMELEQILEQYPGLPIIAHGSHWGKQRTVLPMVLQHKNFHVTFDHMQINYGLEWLVEKGCEDQLIFGSNAPEMSVGAHRFYVDYAEVSDEARRKIAGGNLTRLLKGQAPPRDVVNQNEDAIMTEARAGTPLSPLVLDMHAHILDEGLNGAGGGYTMLKGGPAGTVALAKRMGVDGIGLMSWNGTVGAHADEGNQCTTDALNAAPDTWWGLGTFDPMHETAEQMRAKMETLYADKRFVGLKPYPQYGIAYDDPRYDCWWEFGNERHLYCALHAVKWFQPDEFDSICSRFPNLTVVAYHCGASYEVADTVIALAQKHANFMIEITLTPVCTGIIDYLAQGAGVDRVMYGSDLPMRDPRQQLGWVVYSKLSLEDKKKVLGGNAQRLLDHIRSHQKA